MAIILARIENIEDQIQKNNEAGNSYEHEVVKVKIEKTSMKGNEGCRYYYLVTDSLQRIIHKSKETTRPCWPEDTACLYTHNMEQNGNFVFNLFEKENNRNQQTLVDQLVFSYREVVALRREMLLQPEISRSMIGQARTIYEFRIMWVTTEYLVHLSQQLDKAYAEALKLAEEHQQKKKYQGYVSHSISMTFVQPVRPTNTRKPSKIELNNLSDDSCEDEDMDEFSDAKTAGVPMIGQMFRSSSIEDLNDKQGFKQSKSRSITIPINQGTPLIDSKKCLEIESTCATPIVVPTSNSEVKMEEKIVSAGINYEIPRFSLTLIATEEYSDIEIKPQQRPSLSRRCSRMTEGRSISASKRSMVKSPSCREISVRTPRKKIEEPKLSGTKSERTLTLKLDK